MTKDFDHASPIIAAFGSHRMARFLFTRFPNGCILVANYASKTACRTSRPAPHSQFVKGILADQ